MDKFDWRIVSGEGFNQKGWFIQHISCKGIFLTSSEMRTCYYCNMVFPEHIELQLKLLLDGATEN